MGNRRKRIFSVVFMPTLACNCTCEYCFQDRSSQQMTDEVLHRFLDGLIGYARERNIRGMKIFWQGGDVLTLRPERAREILEIIGARMTEAGIIANNHLQTNLMGYHSGWKEVLQQNFKDKISSSLDYPNLFRKSPSISVEGYYERWIEKKRQIEQDGFSVSVIALPNAETLERGAAEFYDFYKNTARLKSLQINFPFPGLASDFPRELDLEKYSAFLRDLYTIWKEDERSLYLRPFTTLERKRDEPGASTFCIWSYSCADDIIAVAPDGAVAQCDCWILCLDEFKYGTVMEKSIGDLMRSPNRRIFYERTKRLALETECGECPYWSLCHGGCPIRAYRFSKSFFEKDHFCGVYKTLFELIL
jgi:uncharacterized protein